MTNIVLCPCCGGQKTVSKPSFIAGDVNHWVSSGAESYPCPTCDGRGWIDTDVNSDIVVVKKIVLSSLETSENLMDECVNRGEQIKVLNAIIAVRDGEIVDCNTQLARIKELEAMVDEKNSRIANIVSKCQSREKDLELLVDGKDFRIFDLESQRSLVRKARNNHEDELCDRITELEAIHKHDLKLLDDILKVVNVVNHRNMENPYKKNIAFEASQMCTVCDVVSKFRKVHNIVG